MATLVGQLQQGYQQLVGGVTDSYDQLVNAIIRPPRETYTVAELGKKRFRLDEVIYAREDVQLISSRPGRPLLECSHYKPEQVEGQEVPERPCVVFLHGNSSSRTEALAVLPTVLNAGADLFSFDFAGSGMSGGKYVSLGHFEQEDLATVVTHLRNDCKVTTIGLWGRSMGAATALMHGDTDPSIAAMVLDSPFTDLRTLAQDLCQRETYGSVPSWLTDAALSVIRRSIQSRADFDLDDLSPISHATKTFIPAIFGVATGDDFIPPYHSKQIKEAYAGECELLSMKGDHNSHRPAHFLEEVEKFFLRTLHLHVDMIALGKGDKAVTTPRSPRSPPCEARAPLLPPGCPYASELAYAPIPVPPTPDELREKNLEKHRSSDTQDIRSSLLGLGFASKQIDAAMARNSTLEGCVDWILAKGG